MEAARILIVEDEDVARENLVHVLTRQGYEVSEAARGSEAVTALERDQFDLVITDLKLPDVDGMEVLRKTKVNQPHAEVLMVTGHATVDSAVEAMNLGAYHYLSKPLNIAELRALVAKALEKGGLRREVDALRRSVAGRDRPMIIGQSKAMEGLKEQIAQVAAVDSTVLITGETGTGKELVAKSIHALSTRRDKRFMAVNCAAFTEELLGNELFGHDSGAYTGARNTKKGLMEAAQGGTFFLDEIGDMGLSMQAKLLRVLEERTFMRVGGTEEIPVDVRILAATNKDLLVEVNEGTFRQDLFYRLNVIALRAPSLSDRKEDIPLLVSFFLDKYARAFGKDVERVDPKVMELLMAYEYPGNVRELENIMERAVVLCAGKIIEVRNLPPDMAGNVHLTRPAAHEMISLKELEKRHIAWVLEQCDYNRTTAADVLGIDRATIWRKMKRYGLGED